MKAETAFGTVLTAMVTPFTSDGTKIDFDVAGMLEDKRQSIEKQLNNIENGPISCRGELNHIGWQGLEVRRDGLNMRFNLQGKMQCKADLSKFSL